MKNLQRGVVMLLLIIIALLVIVGGAYYFSQKVRTHVLNGSILDVAKKCDLSINIPANFIQNKNMAKKGAFEYGIGNVAYGDYTIANGPYAYSYDSSGKAIQNIVKNALISGAVIAVDFEGVTTDNTKIQIINKLNSYYSREGDHIGSIEHLPSGITKFSARGSFESIYDKEDVYLVNDKCSIHIKMQYNYLNDKSADTYAPQLSKFVGSITQIP